MTIAVPLGRPPKSFIVAPYAVNGQAAARPAIANQSLMAWDRELSAEVVIYFIDGSVHASVTGIAN